MDRSQQIKEVHPGLSYDDAVKGLFSHQFSILVKNLQRSLVKLDWLNQLKNVYDRLTQNNSWTRYICDQKFIK